MRRQHGRGNSHSSSSSRHRSRKGVWRRDGLALVVRIREAYGSIENDEVNEIDLETALAQHAEAEKAVSEATA